jgi:acyl carrier protein
MTPANAPSDQVREIIGRLSAVGPDMLSADACLIEDLGYDSLAIFELVRELERELDLPPLSAEEAMNIVTVGHVEALVAAARSTANAAA